MFRKTETDTEESIEFMIEVTSYTYKDLKSMDFELFYRALGRAIQREEAKSEQIKQANNR